MTGNLQIEVLGIPFERAEADVLLAGFFESDRPLRGGAGRADWRLRGLVSRLLVEERMTGSLGEAVLLATEGVLASPRLLLVGFGDSATLNREALRAHACRALSRAMELGVESAAVSLPLGRASRDIALDASALAVVEGAIAAQPGVPVLKLIVPPGTEGGIADVIRRFGRRQRNVVLEVSYGPKPRPAPQPPAGARLGPTRVGSSRS